MRVFKLSEMTSSQRDKLLRRAELDIEEVLPAVRSIIDDVAKRGDTALTDYTERFDGVKLDPSSLKVTREEIAEALIEIDGKLKEAIERSAENIRRFHERQLPTEIWFMEVAPGVMAGEKATPIPSVGLYVPWGKGSFPSVAMMLSIPAVLAGVERVVICTPPGPDGRVDAGSLAAAEICGVKEIFKVGGAQAIAALAVGSESIPRVDKIMGPGSPYVAAAKRLLYGRVDVGVPSGPSEAVILADETADPELAAADMLIEAEHGPDSAVLLVTHSKPLADQVEKLLPSLIQELPEPRRGFCQQVFSRYGGIALTDGIEESIEFVNRFAPEHMEVLVEDPFSILPRLKNAGEILLGEHTPISACNFSLGPNAILPTGGFARSYSAVSVHDFMKRSSIGYLTADGLEKIGPWAATLADYEGFPAHSRALMKRLKRKREGRS